MKKLSLFLLLAFFTVVTQAQSIQEGELPTTIGEADFDPDMRLVHVGETSDGLKVLALMKKEGAYRKKMGPMMSGGADPVTILALGEFYFDEGLQLKESKYTILKPDGENTMLGDFEVLNEPVRIGKAKVIAKKADCKELYELADIHPELRDGYGTEEAVFEKDFPGPAVYYENVLKYKFSGAVKTVKLRKYTKNQKPPQKAEATTLKGAFKDMFKSTPKVDPYSEVEKELDIEDTYKGRGKKDFWMFMSDDICDPVDGAIFAHHGHYYSKDAPRKRNNHFEQELVVFDKEGKVVNHLDLNFDKPMELEQQVVFEDKGQSKNENDIKAVGYMFKELTGAFTKKVNPNPDPNARHFYKINEAGSQDYTFSFYLEGTNEKIKKIMVNPKGDNFSMLSYAIKPSTYSWYQMGAQGVVAKNEIKEGNPLFAPLSTAKLNVDATQLRPFTETFDAAGNRRLKYRVVNVTTDPSTKEKKYQSKGFLDLLLDEKGDLKIANFINRAENADLSLKPSLEVIKEEGDIVTWMYQDPLRIKSGDTFVTRYLVRILSQNKNTLEFVDLLKDDDQFLLGEDARDYIHNKEKNLMYFVLGGKIKAISL